MLTEERFALNLILDEKARLLMLLRHDEAKLGPNQWGLPAGKIETGETPKEAAERERIEEIGLTHAVQFVRYYGPIRDTYYEGKYEIHLFQFNWEKGEIHLNREHKDFTWVAKEEISEMDVMLGIEEDIAILEIWPVSYLNKNRLPK